MTKSTLIRYMFESEINISKTASNKMFQLIMSNAFYQRTSHVVKMLSRKIVFNWKVRHGINKKPNIARNTYTALVNYLLQRMYSSVKDMSSLKTKDEINNSLKQNNSYLDLGSTC